MDKYEKQECIDTIRMAQNARLFEESAVKHHELMAKLALENEVSVVRRCAHYGLAAMCRLYTSYKNDACKKGDTRKQAGLNKDMREALGRIEAEIEASVTGCKVTAAEVVPCGYDHYMYAAKFSVEGVKQLLTVMVPDIDRVTVANYMSANEGRARLGYYAKEGVDDVICSSYDMDDLKAAFGKFAKKK